MTMPFSWDQLIPGQSQTFKQKVISLYIGENCPLDGVGSVREYMKNHYNFNKSVSTYRREFLKWGVKKNDYPATVHRSSQHSFDSGYGTASNRTSTATTAHDPSPSPHRKSEHSLLRPSLQHRPSSHPQTYCTLSESDELDLQIPEAEPADDESALSEYTADDYLFDHYLSKQGKPTSHPGADGNAARHHYQPPHTHPSRCSRSGAISEFRDGGLESCHCCGATKLHHLASISRSTDIAVFKEVVSLNLNFVNQLDKEGNSPLHFAVGAGATLEQLATLRQAGAHLARLNYSGQTLLHILDPRLYARTVPALLNFALQNGLTLSQRDCDGKTPLHCIFGRTISLTNLHDLMPFLQAESRAMTFMDRHGNTPFDVLRENWRKTNGGVHLALVKANFIAYNIPIALRKEDYGELRPLVPIPDVRLATTSPDEQCADILNIINRSVQEPYYQDVAGQNVLHALAGFFSHANYNVSCYVTPYKLLECLQQRLENYKQVGIDVNQYNQDGLTPLHCFLCATFDIDLDIQWLVPMCVDALLQAGADPTLRDGHGNTALHLASSRGRFECTGKIMNVLSERLDRAHYLLYLSSLNDIGMTVVAEAKAAMSSEPSEANEHRKKCIGLVRATLSEPLISHIPAPLSSAAMSSSTLDTSAMPWSAHLLNHGRSTSTSSVQSASGHQKTPIWPCRTTSFGDAPGEQRSAFEG